MTVRDKLGKELEQVPDSLVEEILDFCIFLKQRQQVKTKDVKVLEGNSVLISEDEWRGIQETIYLLSIPQMRESIVEGLSTSVHDCSETLEW
jgi:PHD/YefM family antitoxin component YafN of YafNO toxin-antitoxin module